MEQPVAVAVSETRAGSIRDFIALTKPRLTTLVVATAAFGFAIGGGRGIGHGLTVVFGTTLLVAAANALNSWLERDTDARMKRTANRPLPQRRVTPDAAFLFGSALAVIGLVTLTVAANTLTAALGFLALASYCAAYTPLKRVSDLALYVGALPGALPPLMGVTAVRGEIEPIGVSLFALLFSWQVPHFLAIASMRRDEYTNADLLVTPAVRGERSARIHALVAALVFAGAVVAPYFVGFGGRVYLLIGASTTVAFIALILRDLGGSASGGAARTKWGKRVFLASIAHLPLLLIALALDTR